MKAIGVVALFASVVLACQPGVPNLSVGSVEYSTRPGSGEPNIHVTADGRAILSWLEPAGEDRHALRLAVRDQDGWSEPLTVLESDRFFVNWADFPAAIELADGTWMAHWLEKVEGGSYAYHIKFALSHDGGQTWSDGVVPHRDDSPTEHGFVSMVPLEEGAAMIWLDGRAMKVPDAGEDHDGVDLGEMSLRGTRVSSDGALGSDELLDSRVCECCQTALAVTSSGLIAAYRDRSEAEIRNISAVRLAEGAWTQPAYVADDGWYYPGCPVNGPQLSALGDTVAVAWFTAPERQPAVYVAFSVDAGATFGAPIRVDEGEALGRVDIELVAADAAVVVWLERSESAASLRARWVRRDGAASAAVTLAATSEARQSGFPRIARVGDHVLVAWTSVRDDGGIRVTGLSWGD